MSSDKTFPREITYKHTPVAEAVTGWCVQPKRICTQTNEVREINPSEKNRSFTFTSHMRDGWRNYNNADISGKTNTSDNPTDISQFEAPNGNQPDYTGRPIRILQEQAQSSC